MPKEEEARQGTAATAEPALLGRSTIRTRHCWEIAHQLPGLQFNCEECYAYFVQQDCWSLWALRRPGFKPCCQKKGDCTACVVLNEHVGQQRAGQLLQIERVRPMRPASTGAKRICQYLHVYNGEHEVTDSERKPEVARALHSRSADFRCSVRGVRLDTAYVSDICVSRHVDDCVFLTHERPRIQTGALPMLHHGAGKPDHGSGGDKTQLGEDTVGYAGTPDGADSRPAKAAIRPHASL